MADRKQISEEPFPVDFGLRVPEGSELDKLIKLCTQPGMEKALQQLASQFAAKEEAAENWRDSFKSVGQLQDGGVRFLIEGLFPEGCTFIGALPGAGKTWFGLSIAKALVTGNKFLGRFPVPEKLPCLYMIPETSGRAFKRRLVQLQIPDDPSMFLCRTISEGKTLMLDDPALLEAVREMRPVVFLDTAIRFSTATDENSASQNKQLVDDIRELIVAGAVGVFAFHHATKASSGKEITQANSLRGTGDYAAMAESSYGLAVDQTLYDNGNGPLEIKVVCTKPRDISPPPKPFTLISTMLDERGKIIDVLEKHHDFLIKDDGEAVQSVKDTIFRILLKDPEISVESVTTELNVACATNLSKATVNRYMQKDGFEKTGPIGLRGKKTWVCGDIRIADLANKTEAKQKKAADASTKSHEEIPF